MNQYAPRRRKFNPKRRLHKGLCKERAEWLANAVCYRGSPLHKRVPGDFGLTPPSSPRPGKSLCDGVEIFQIEVAQKYLCEGVELGLVSNDADQSFPRYIWAVAENESVLEARCDDYDNGTYHGYPLEQSDPMTDIVIKRWREVR